MNSHVLNFLLYILLSVKEVMSEILEYVEFKVIFLNWK